VRLPQLLSRPPRSVPCHNPLHATACNILPPTDTLLLLLLHHIETRRPSMRSRGSWSRSMRLALPRHLPRPLYQRPPPGTIYLSCCHTPTAPVSYVDATAGLPHPCQAPRWTRSSEEPLNVPHRPQAHQAPPAQHQFTDPTTFAAPPLNPNPSPPAPAPAPAPSAPPTGGSLPSLGASQSSGSLRPHSSSTTVACAACGYVSLHPSLPLRHEATK